MSRGLTKRQVLVLVVWGLLVALATMLLIVSSATIAHAEVCCVTCHEGSTCASCHAPDPVDSDAVPDKPATFDPDKLTHSQFGPDGTYYVYVVGVHLEHEELEPGGLLYEAERIVGDSGCFEVVGPGYILADDQGEDPALYGDTTETEDATAALEGTVTP